ncbi:hypothetical protein BVC93_00180 [Mycobacterium sp. MS1601]|uniref:vWA domain-containing protein n=1 Tax=Mycobacterium sp. MS1601 TaxID=1936029 RepID=UPI00097959F6|nr:vWA domain-containing protein [Mycobacterium sp. MS1601]AQA01091.1 hypothetical protein BVC93_00180 [Mycobacterium sp. MS1601]
MTFTPVGSATLLLVLGAVLVLLRVLALYRRRRSVLRWVGVTAAVLLLLGAAARPGIDASRDVSADTSQAAGPNVFLVVDRSAGAPVADMRADIDGVIDAYPGARIALISFATRATMDWPLSDDVTSLRSVISGLSPYLTDIPDPALQVNAFAARDVLRTKVDAAAGEYPGASNLVFYFGTGDPESLVSRGSFDMAPGSVAGGAVFAYEPSDPARLQSIADQLGVPLGEVLPPVEAQGTAEPVHVADRYEFYWLLALLASALLLAEIAATLREYHKNRLRL